MFIFFNLFKKNTIQQTTTALNYIYTNNMLGSNVNSEEKFDILRSLLNKSSLSQTSQVFFARMRFKKHN